MPDEIIRISLANIKDGAAIEMFDRAIEKALININDINTTTGKREVVLKMGFLPSEDRTLVEIDFSVGTKLVNQGGIKVSADLKIDEKGRAYASERNIQRNLPFGNVTDIRKGD